MGSEMCIRDRCALRQMRDRVPPEAAHPCIACLYNSRRAQPVIFRVGRSTDRTHTANLRDSRRRSTSKYSYFHFFQTKFTSGCISMPNFSRTEARTASESAIISLPFAPPQFTSTKACLSCTAAGPKAFPFHVYKVCFLRPNALRNRQRLLQILMCGMRGYP